MGWACMCTGRPETLGSPSSRRYKREILAASVRVYLTPQPPSSPSKQGRTRSRRRSGDGGEEARRRHSQGWGGDTRVHYQPPQTPPRMVLPQTAPTSFHSQASRGSRVDPLVGEHIVVLYLRWACMCDAGAEGCGLWALCGLAIGWYTWLDPVSFTS